MNSAAKTALAGILLSAPLLAPAQTFKFSIDPSLSVFQGASEFRLGTRGSVIGVYNAQTNPRGTRTKPGLTGAFGSTENLPVRVEPLWVLQGQNTLRTSGGFSLALEPAASRAVLTGFRADRLTGAAATLASMVSLNNQAFRTQSPAAAYPAFVDPFRMGGVEIDRFVVEQKEARVPGVIRAMGNGVFQVNIPFIAVYVLNVKQFGQTRPITFEAPSALIGEMKVNGNEAIFRRGGNFRVEEAGRELSRELQPFTFQIPAGLTAKATLKGSLTLGRVSVRLAGTSVIAAKGIRQ